MKNLRPNKISIFFALTILFTVVQTLPLQAVTKNNPFYSLLGKIPQLSLQHADETNPDENNPAEVPPVVEEPIVQDTTEDETVEDSPTSPEEIQAISKSDAGWEILSHTFRSETFEIALPAKENADAFYEVNLRGDMFGYGAVENGVSYILGALNPEVLEMSNPEAVYAHILSLLSPEMTQNYHVTTSQVNGLLAINAEWVSDDSDEDKDEDDVFTQDLEILEIDEDDSTEDSRVYNSLTLLFSNQNVYVMLTSSETDACRQHAEFVSSFRLVSKQ